MDSERRRSVDLVHLNLLPAQRRLVVGLDLGLRRLLRIPEGLALVVHRLVLALEAERLPLERRGQPRRHLALDKLRRDPVEQRELLLLPVLVVLHPALVVVALEARHLRSRQVSVLDRRPNRPLKLGSVLRLDLAQASLRREHLHLVASEHRQLRQTGSGQQPTALQHH